MQDIYGTASTTETNGLKHSIMYIIKKGLTISPLLALQEQ